VFDVHAVQETIQTCRPTAALCGGGHGAPATRDGVESRIVTIAREALAKFRAPVWGGQITTAPTVMALARRSARDIMPKDVRRPRSDVVGCDRTFGQGDPGQASASGAMHKQAA